MVLLVQKLQNDNCAHRIIEGFFNGYQKDNEGPHSYYGRVNV
jgi:hypothetical protein